MTNEPYSFAILRNRLVLTGDLVARTALRIGTGRSGEITGNDLPVLRDALGQPFIPGASLKGALRARTEALIRAVAPTEARDLLEIEDLMRAGLVSSEDAKEDELRNGLLTRKEDANWREKRRTNAAQADQYLSDLLWKRSSLVELTFGAPWLAGRVFVKDALVDPSLWFGQFEVRNGVALNRDTETVDEGKLYDYEVVPAGTRFGFELVIENAEPWQLGMLLLVLQPWERGDAQIGGFRSRGLGYVQLELQQSRYIEIANADDVLRLLGYETDIATSDTVSDKQADEWRKAFANLLREKAQKATQPGADHA